MPKNKKTRKEKIRTEMRKKEAESFHVKEEWLKTKKKNGGTVLRTGEFNDKYLRLDLTKTFLLSMLVLALELGLWQYLSRR